MTEEQKKRLMDLVYGMPFLGGKTVSRNDFAEGLIANLEILQGTLKAHAKYHQELEDELREYRRAVRGLRFLLGEKK